MKILIDIADLVKYKSRDKIPLECEYCKNTFFLSKNYVQCALKGNSHAQGRFCSRQCGFNSQKTDKIQLACKQCNKTFERFPGNITYNQKRGRINHFCSTRCNGLYNSQHKTTGSNRSKLEKWLSIKLAEMYPNLFISYNDRETINAELDIYIPSLKIAFELNGIFHFENIFGQLERTQNNDKRKFQACIEKGISLCVIDTSKQKYFKEKNSQQFLNIITNLINSKMEEGTGIQPDTN